jgi:hypothetical protein
LAKFRTPAAVGAGVGATLAAIDGAALDADGPMPHAARMAGRERAEPAIRPPRPARRRKARRESRSLATARSMARSIWVS